jgi:hypothetical protein
MLSAGIVLALQVAAGSWETARTSLTLDRRVATANSLFHSLLAGALPSEAWLRPGGDAGPRRFPFFQGEPAVTRFVSSFSVAAGRRAGLQITEIWIAPGPRGQRVLLNQRPYLGPFSAGALVEGFASEPGLPALRPVFAPVRPLPSSLILADELAGGRFSYLMPSRRPGETAAWLARWTDNRQLPRAITVELEPRQNEARLLR